ncbi:MAG: Gfo/Idh/MocA family oxidoreductase [Acidobacteriota bacterium]|nr:MAG: Gfo/Idh/MocA family oxidoreductase [Acidobacteriota bacterium]
MKTESKSGFNEEAKPTRRDFLGKAAGTVASASLFAAAASPAVARPMPKVTGRVLGANDRINLGFIGCGMQFQGLLRRGFDPRKENKGDFEYAAVCDVWQPRVDNAKKLTGAESTTRDYREVIARDDIDGVVLAVPDHWHFQMAKEACEAGKDVYLEKPMTYTIDEAAKLTDIVHATERVLQVGGSGPADRLNWQIHDYISSGKMGKILWGLISYNRNTDAGMWDYPMPGIGGMSWPDAEVSAANLDWDMWLGPAAKRPFSNERYFRWRKYWDYSGGNATDLLYHRLGTMSTMLGFEFPTRVTGAGGIYVQKNREVPDTYMTMVEYPGDYSVNMISCMANATSAPLTIYGNWATLEVRREVVQADNADNSMGDNVRRRRRSVEFAAITPERQFRQEFMDANGGAEEVRIDAEPSEDLIDNWMDCMRSRKQPVYDVLKGYQVMVAIKLGVESYRQGKVFAFDPASKQIVDPGPRPAYLPGDA